MWGTIPAGAGSNSVDFSIDGGTPNITSRTSNGSAVFDEQYYASPLLRETYHTIVVTNRGSNANGNTEFLLDRFEFETSDDVPSFAPSGVSVTPSSLPSSSATGSSGAAASSGGSKPPIGAIAGAVIGSLALIIVILVYLLWGRRKRHGEDSSNHEKTSKTGRTCRQFSSFSGLLTNLSRSLPPSFKLKTCPDTFPFGRIRLCINRRSTVCPFAGGQSCCNGEVRLSELPSCIRSLIQYQQR